MKYGVPQGSILRPLLVLWCLRSLLDLFSELNCKACLYADEVGLGD